jgi:hypothetical protein
MAKTARNRVDTRPMSADVQPGTAAAARPVERVTLKDPTGVTRDLQKFVPIAELMQRRGQIDNRQLRAAQRYGEACDALRRGLSSSLEMRVSGGGRASPSEAQLLAAELVADAHRILGVMDAKVISLVVCEGFTITEVGDRVSTGASRDYCKHIGLRFREGLTLLANAWWPERGSQLVGGLLPGVELQPVTAGEVVPGAWAHATPHKVFRSGGDRS